MSISEQTNTQPLTDDAQGMSYLNRLPRRIVVLYLPLAVFVFVLLFPFYWMAITAVKPNSQLTDYNNYSPFWVVGRRSTISNICCSRPPILAGCGTPLSLRSARQCCRLQRRSLPPMPSSACASRDRGPSAC